VSTAVNIRQLMALSFPKLEDKVRELITCNYLIDALDDSAMELKVGEKVSCHPDATYNEALNLEKRKHNIETRRASREDCTDSY